MAIRLRRGVWVDDHRDVAGIRRTPSYPSEEAAITAALRRGAFTRRPGSRRTFAVDPQVTVAVYAPRWLAAIAPPLLKPRAHEAHAAAVAHYIGPRLGACRVGDLRRRDVIAFLTSCRAHGVSGRPLTPGSVRLIYSALRAMLNAAIDDELIVGNVAAKLGRKVRVQPTKQERRARVEQRTLEPSARLQLLEAIRQHEPAWYPLILTYDRAGLRLGEGLALELDDLRLASGRLNIRHAINERSGALEPPKHGTRIVELSPTLAAILKAHIAGLKRAALATGQPLAPWLFPSRAGTALEARNVRRALARCARKAGLGPVTPQDLRHTFGSTLAARGESPQYVQQQMGHASVQITIDTYGSAFAARPHFGVAALDDGMPTAGCYHEAAGRGGVVSEPRTGESGSKVVAESGLRRRGGRASARNHT
jgi:integrase